MAITICGNVGNSINNSTSDSDNQKAIIITHNNVKAPTVINLYPQLNFGFN